MNDATDTPNLGHNSRQDPLLNPDMVVFQLETDHEALFTRRDELMAAVTRFHAKYPSGIQDEEAQGKAAEFVAQLKACAKQFDAARTTAGEPYRIVTIAINALLKGGSEDPLLAAATKIQGAQTAYARLKVEREREAAREEAKRLHKEATEAAAAAQRVRDEEEARAAMTRKTESLFGLTTDTPRDAPPPPSAAAELETQAQVVAAQAAAAEKRATGSNASLGQSRSTLGAVASLRDNWTFELEDITKVDPKYLLLNEQMVRAEVKVLKDKCVINGVRVFNDPKVSSYAR